MLEIDFQCFPTAVLSLDPHLSVVSANSNALKLFSLPKLETNMILDDFFPISVLETLKPQIKSLFNKTIPFIPFKEYTLNHKEKGVFSADIALMPVEKNGKRQVAVFIQESPLLHNQGYQFQDILTENTSDMFFISDLEGNLLLFSKSAALYHGYSIKEMQNFSFLNLFADSMVFGDILEKLKKEKKYNCIVRKKRRDGSTFYVSASFLLIQQNNSQNPFILSIEKDVSDTMEYQKILLKYIKDQTILKDILEIYLKAQNYKEALIILAKKLKKHFGIVGIHIVAQDLCIEKIGKETSFVKNMRFFSAINGQNIVFKVFAAKQEDFPNPDEILFYTFSNFFNAMEKFKIIDLLKKEKEKAELSDRLKSEFLANISHEIRTPLNVITGFLHLLQTTPLNREQQEYLDPISFNAQKLLSMINHILTLACIESGEWTPETLEIDPFYLIHEIAQANSFKAKEKNLEFVEVIKPLKPIITDSSKLAKILTSLLDNAIKFTDKGKVTLKAFVNPNNCIQIEIKDTGIGIPPEKKPLIFNKFFQLDGSHTRKYGGTGLGLAMVKALTERLKIQLECHSNKGVGTHITLILPNKI